MFDLYSKFCYFIPPTMMFEYGKIGVLTKNEQCKNQAHTK